MLARWPYGHGAVSGDPEKRTPADKQTVRNVFVIGPDKKIKLVLVYPMTTGRTLEGRSYFLRHTTYSWGR